MRIGAYAGSVLSMGRIVLVVGCFIPAFFTWTSTALAQQTDLVLCLDGSGSISGADFTLEKLGTSSAIQDPSVVPQNGSLRLTVIQFSSSAVVEVGPRSSTPRLPPTPWQHP